MQHASLHHGVRLLSSQSTSQLFDIAIVGGGLVGFALAAACGTHPVLKESARVLLLDPAREPTSDAPRPQTNSWLDHGFGNRVSAVSAGNARMLSHFGSVWSDVLAASRATPFSHMKVGYGAATTAVEFAAQDAGLDQLGYIVDNKTLQRSLSNYVKQLENVTVLYNTTANSAVFQNDVNATGADWAKLLLTNGDEITSRILVGADGANSTVRNSAQIPVMSWDYDQEAVVASLEIDSVSDNNCAWQRFLPRGPIALLPLSKNASSLVWSTTKAHAAELKALSPDEFVLQINEAFHSSFGAVPPFEAPRVIQCDPHSRASFPLSFLHASQYVKHRVALIGDASHRLHPLAGQGVNLGFGDAFGLVASFAHSLETGQDLGSIHQLLEFETARQRANVPVLAAVDIFSRIFTAQSGILAMLCNAGMSVAASSPFIRNQMMQIATA